MAHAAPMSTPLPRPRMRRPQHLSAIVAVTLALTAGGALLPSMLTVSDRACTRYDSCLVAWLMQYGTP